MVFLWAAEGRLFIFCFCGIGGAILCAWMGCFVVRNRCGLVVYFSLFWCAKAGVRWAYFMYLVGDFVVVFCVALGFVCAH